MRFRGRKMGYRMKNIQKINIRCRIKWGVGVKNIIKIDLTPIFLSL